MSIQEQALTPGSTRAAAFEYMRGHVLCAVLAALGQIGVLDLLATRGLRPADLGANDFLATATLRYLAERGVVRVDGEVHRLTPAGRALYDDRGYLIWLSGGYGAALHGFGQLLTGEQKFGSDIDRDVRWVAVGTALASAKDLRPHVAEVVREVAFERVADIGCGNGHFLVELCRTAGVAGIGVDISPDACAEARRGVTAAELDDRVEIVQADAVDLDAVPGLEDVQLVVTFFFLHEVLEHGRAVLVEYLSGLLRRLPPGAHLLTAEICPPESGEGTLEPVTPEYALTQALMEQNLLPEREWLRVFEDAGFLITRVVRADLPGARVILARKPAAAS